MSSPSGHYLLKRQKTGDASVCSDRLIQDIINVDSGRFQGSFDLITDSEEAYSLVKKLSEFHRLVQSKFATFNDVEPEIIRDKVLPFLGDQED